MSEEGEKTCPLCAEEMDLTDQQLKPCRCGYEVCVWCWHHIMEMAEKDETEGRCPACRTPYDKERIVGMASSCERLVAGVSMEKKHKSHKGKTRTTDSRKQLTNVRVIQRNLVYIVGLPLNLADEDLLQHKEYFGQYGKVLKVSISRTSAGTIQQFTNNTCSVYITYAREDEAVRCIQSVHAFVLDGSPLRACFGTTKYCHAWLRNVPCNNPDCLYLHEIGSQEDSFTKDEIISAYSRVDQITGVASNMQRRAGTVLPPPADDYCVGSSTVTVKPVPPVTKSSSNNPDSSTRTSPPTSSSGRPGGLPPAASWGARASNSNLPAASVAFSNGPTKQKAETVHGPPVIATSLSGSSQTPTLPDESGKRPVLDEDVQARESKSKTDISDSVKVQERITTHLNGIVTSSMPLEAPTVKLTSQLPSTVDGNGEAGNLLFNKTLFVDERPCSPCERGWSTMDGVIENICGEVSSISIERQPSDDSKLSGMNLNTFISPQNQDVPWHECEKLQEQSIPAAASKECGPTRSSSASGEVCGVSLDIQAPITQILTSKTEDDFDSQRLGDAIVNQGVMPASSSLHILSHLRDPLESQVTSDCTSSYSVNSPIISRVPDEGLAVNQLNSSVASNGFFERFLNRAPGQEISLPNGRRSTVLGTWDGELSSFDSQPASNVGENHIISNILSLDLDSWDDSLKSPQTLSKLLGEPNKQDGPVNPSNSLRSQFSSQSRFSFARQEDSRNHLFDVEPSLGTISQTTNIPLFQGGFGNRDFNLERQGNAFGFPQQSVEFADNLLGGHPGYPTSKLSGSKSQISAPPGFSMPSRPPPPGFTSHERSDQSFEFLKSGHQLHETSSYLRNPYYASPSGNMNTTNDIEFMDPAILAVGKGRLPNGINSPDIDMKPHFDIQAPGYENDSRLHLLMQRSLTPHHNLRYNDVRDNFSPPSGADGFNSWHMEQPQENNLSPFSQVSLQQPRTATVSNGHWDGWNDNHAPNNVDIAELLRNDRLGFNKVLGGYDDSKFGTTNFGGIYNRSFGM